MWHHTADRRRACESRAVLSETVSEIQIQQLLIARVTCSAQWNSLWDTATATVDCESRAVLSETVSETQLEQLLIVSHVQCSVKQSLRHSYSNCWLWVTCSAQWNSLSTATGKTVLCLSHAHKTDVCWSWIINQVSDFDLRSVLRLLYIQTSV